MYSHDTINKMGPLEDHQTGGLKGSNLERVKRNWILDAKDLSEIGLSILYNMHADQNIDHSTVPLCSNIILHVYKQ